MPKLATPYAARDNARKIADILAAGHGHADLYRTIVAGPSGQRADFLAGRVRYLPDGQYEFEIIDMSGNGGDRAGLARLDVGRWSITRVDYDGTHDWLGYASSLAVGVDVLIWGEHTALRNHDHARISRGWITKQGPVKVAV